MYDNKNFNAFAGCSLNDEPTNFLVNQDRVFVTSATFTKDEAASALPHKGTQTSYEDGEATHVFGGYIVTVQPRDFEEARAIAVQRGFNETIDGVMGRKPVQPDYGMATGRFA
jgi:hypothetical protein